MRPRGVRKIDAARRIGTALAWSNLAGRLSCELRSPPGCEVYWRRRGDAFLGEMKPGACRFKSERSGKTIVVSDDLYLDDDEIWIHDRAVDAEGGYVYGNKAGIPNKLRKVSWFACWLSVRREGVADGDPRAWSFDRDVAVHDGGELAWVKTDARDARVGLKIRRPVWPSGPNQDSDSRAVRARRGRAGPRAGRGLRLGGSRGDATRHQPALDAGELQPAAVARRPPRPANPARQSREDF